MVPKSLRSLKLQLTIAVKPSLICQEVLGPLIEAAAYAILVCVDPNPEDLARMTWGLAPFVRKDSNLKLFVIVTDPVPSEMEPDLLSERWNQSLKSQEIAHRLSFYKYFSQEGRFTLCVSSTAGCDSASLLKTRLNNGIGVVLIGDTDSTMAEILWKKVSDSAGTAEATADFRWSFGDPMRAVKNLHDTIEALSTERKADSFAQIESALYTLISNLPEPLLPWKETFSDRKASTFSLYRHQESTVEEWFKNQCRGIFKMCTGAGKTISSLAAIWRRVELAHEREEHVPPVIVTVPTRVLADQWCEEIQKIGFDRPLQAYNSKDKWHPMLEAWLENQRIDKASFVVSTYKTFADKSFQRVLARLQDRGLKAVWIADEMHNLASPRLMALAIERENYFIARLGLSATPEIENEPDITARLMGYFGNIVGEPYELEHGIRDGVLCRYRYFPFPCYLSSELGRKYLELLKEIDLAASEGRTEIELYRQKRDLVRKSGIQVQAFAALLPQLLNSGRRLSHTLVYCPPGYGSVTDSCPPENSDSIDEEPDEKRLLNDVFGALRAHHVEVSCILGETSGPVRDSTLREFGAGRIQVVCAIGCLDEGVDVPSIERAVILSSVNRKKQFIQRRGRILRHSRADPNKIAEIYDVIVLPHGSHLPKTQAERLLRVELDRYQEFAQLAMNREDADRVIKEALAIAMGIEKTTP